MNEEIHTCLTDLRQDLNQIDGLYQKFISLRNDYTRTVKLNLAHWWASAIDRDGSPLFSTYAARANYALQAGVELISWIDYLRSRQSLIDCQLAELVSLAESNQILPSQLLAAGQLIFHHSLLNQVVATHPLLMNFNGLSHEQLRRKFAEFDMETISLYRKQVASIIAQKQIPTGKTGTKVGMYTELQLINLEINKKKKHIPIRQLVNRAGKALQAMKPCFMMGPLSVAQYLAPGSLYFDLIVMDEASQLKPEEALGAIARGSQVVVVGDPKQLPPSNFFDSLDKGDDDDDENVAAISDAESILDIASLIYQPKRRLRWHYRSRHDSLIAFSNKEFYDNNLIVFPSPIPRNEELGVKFNFVSDGVYQGQRNEIEARRVVADVLAHMQNKPNDTLGVVTFNKKQKDLIEDILQEAAKNDPFAEQYLSLHKLSDVSAFVKNLENVQGDEFDVVFISATYGKDTNGNFYQRFGPITQAQGHRRLNVLFTRAKKQLVIYSSMDADWIKVEPSSSWGVRALKAYLSYARTGILDHTTLATREPDSDFEISVASALRDKGFEVVPQVGVAGFFIDLAVRHPRKQGAFILGVECDGATYHSSFSARDRDRLRQAALESFGWKIYRIWSTDWFKNPRKEIERLVNRINEVLRQEQI
jgi:very-short-patch-repair endonuclease